MKIKAFLAGMLLLNGMFFVSCKNEDSSPFTGLKLSLSKTSADVEAEISIKATYYKEDDADSSLTVEYSLSDSTNGAYFGTAGKTATSAASGTAVSMTLGSSPSIVTVTASCNGSTASAKVRASAGKFISLTDISEGYASITMQTANPKTVRTKSELVSALSSGGLIYVSGTIDVSEGCLPTEAGGSTNALDDFVRENSSYSSYSDFQAAYAAACSKETNDGSSSSPESSLGSVLWGLNKKYGKKICLYVKSNTTIIGLENAVIKGGSFQISGASNVVIRNLTIQDAYDPFPHHEENDGFNGQWDGIALNNSSNNNIWIDHCTLEDTMNYKNVTINGGTQEKWQTYDGLCDITKGSKNVTISYCLFKNHDKTMLIGSGSGDLSGGNITIHHNRFLNCGQRLPMTTYPNMHIYNNSYERDTNAYYSQQASIAARYAAYTIIAEGNYFGSGVKNCITASTNAAGKCYQNDNIFTSGRCTLSTQSEKPFTPSYSYMLDTASEIPDLLAEDAGAGKWSVKQ